MFDQDPGGWNDTAVEPVHFSGPFLQMEILLTRGLMNMGY